MSELEPEEELVQGSMDQRELIAILNGVLATLDLVADLVAEEDEEIADKIDAAMEPIVEVIHDLGGEVYASDTAKGLAERYLQ
ncbi:MAG: hypothetical protein HYV63_19420 [Candidatus Schekmanbacteria bacterium]|nr:hypothetical protein [Candidatus Schekmanbacteria bacterium]